jgi:hypothetical protein
MDETLAKLISHEAVCAERYTGINARLKRIEQMLYGAAATMIGNGADVIWHAAASAGPHVQLGNVDNKRGVIVHG